MTDPVLLGGYAAKRCPVRVHNDFSPAVPKLTWDPSPEDKARLDAGNAFEVVVFDQLKALNPDCVLVDDTLHRDDKIKATVSAMDAGVGLILGGWLPDDPAGGRTGRPDLLIRVGDGYLPGDVKNHKTVEPAKKTAAVLSALTRLGTRMSLPTLTTTPHRFEDGMQLAHYTRMLQACGYHAGEELLLGAILGTSEVRLDPDSEPERMLAWHDLAEPTAFTYSRSRGKVRRSLLERYDHEHAFRVKVAEHAREIVGHPDDLPPLVTPIGQAECATCPYQIPCAAAMGDDPSVAITIGRLDTREWLALRSLGVTTTLELADLDLDDEAFIAAYAAKLGHRGITETRKRLMSAVERAAMIRDGIDFWPTGLRDAPIDVPTVTVEIDLDIESDQKNRVYMWGVRIRRGTDDTTATYVPDFTVWDPLDEETERALAARFAQWLRDQLSAAEAAGETLRVFH